MTGRTAGTATTLGATPLAGPASMLLSEEQLQTELVTVPIRRIVVRRHVVEERRMVEVVLRREELTVEERPLPGEAAVGSPGERTPLVVLLRQEEPVVTTRTVPYERVTVSVNSVQTDEVVTASVRHEKLESS